MIARIFQAKNYCEITFEKYNATYYYGIKLIFHHVSTQEGENAMKTMIHTVLGLGCVFTIALSSVAAEKLIVDDFESRANVFFSKSGVYKREPSDAKKGYTSSNAYSGEQSLFVGFKKQSEGWCGYFLEFKTGSNYFDATPYSKVTFMIKGKRGGENFQVGMADKYWYEAGDSIKSDCITNYLPAGEVTTEWQKAEIPLQVFVDRRSDFDLTQLGSMAFCFEPGCFENGTGQGVIYIDEVAFE